MQFCNLNGQLTPIEKMGLTIENRAFKYGDGLFESIRMMEGTMPLFNYHAERLFKTLAFLEYTIPAYWEENFFRNEILKLTGRSGNFRIRLTLTRNGGGLYTPIENDPIFYITAQPIETSIYQLDTQEINLGIYPKLKLSPGPLTEIKTNNALLYVLASNYKKNSVYDEVLLKNTYGRIAEATSSNIFIIKGEFVYTPALSEGCLDGVMRRYVINLLQKMKWKVIESKIDIKQLENAEEAFLTNAIQGIKPIAKFRKRFGKQKINLIFEELKKDILFKISQSKK